MNDLLSKRFLVFALIWSLILGFAIKGALATIAYSLVVTPLIGIPFMIASLFAIIVVAHVVTRAEYYNESAITNIYAVSQLLYLS